eukprot:m.85851 g.85851  ORF g.85851 m.85851 type:complete len:102 (-) comp50891_c0_seq25:583-888(-)
MLLSVILAGVCLLATPVAAFDAVLIAPLVIGCCFFIIVFGCCGWFKQQALLRTMQIQGRAGGMESTSFDNNNQDPFSVVASPAPLPPICMKFDFTFAFRLR